MAENKELVFRTYSEILQDPRWQRKRLKILERDNFTCVCCGDKETTLQVHHLEYKGNPWEVDNDKLITTCRHCHTAIEFFKINWQHNFIANKRTCPDDKTFFLVLILDEGLTFCYINGKDCYLIAHISHKTIGEVYHDLIDFWMKAEQQHFLTDKRKC